MPVQTRNQVKNPNTKEIKKNFNSGMKKLFASLREKQGKENRMIVALEIYEYMNKHLPEIVDKCDNERWIRFVAVLFNKTTHTLSDEQQKSWVCVDKALVKKFITEVYKSRTLCMSIIKSNPWLFDIGNLKKTRQEVALAENTRPRRVIMRVDYKGM